jgi:COP9 signalosome complex subunit 5
MQDGPAVMGGDAAVARAVFEAENDVRAAAADDKRYFYDEADQAARRAARPWRTDPHYFQDVHVSAVALIKMVMHARSGGSIEIMGSIQGQVADRAFVVNDVFPLPVEGTETRVNAGAEGNEFMVAYNMECPKVARREGIIGWYHSHPGYGCWLSGIDVGTQSSNQQYMEPFLAIVVDPVRTMSSGKVDIGSFRTYPADYTPPNEAASEYQTIPLEKIEDFGVHSSRYYQLNMSYFKSSLDARLLDLLWNKYWARALSSSPLLQGESFVVQQLSDLAKKIAQAEAELEKTSGGAGRPYFQSEKQSAAAPSAGKVEGKLEQIAKDAQKCCGDHSHALMTMFAKNSLFNNTNHDAIAARAAAPAVPPAAPVATTADAGSAAGGASL